MGLQLRARSEKKIHRVETHTDSQVKKFRAQLSVNKVMLTVFWDMKGPIKIDFLEKDTIVNSPSFCQLLRQNSPFLLNDPRMIYNLDKNTIMKTIFAKKYERFLKCLFRSWKRVLQTAKLILVAMLTTFRLVHSASFFRRLLSYSVTFQEIRDSNKRSSSEFPEGYRVRQKVPGEGRKVQRPKRCKYYKQDEVNEDLDVTF